MKNKTTTRVALESFTSTLIVVLVTSGLSLITNYLTGADGELTIGQPVTVPSASAQRFVPLEIRSFREDENLQVVLEVPAGVNYREMASSHPIGILRDSTAVGAAGHYVLRLQRFPARRLTRVFLAADSTVQLSDIVPRETGRLNLDVVGESRLQSRLERAASSMLWTALVYAITFFLANLLIQRWFEGKMEVLERTLESLNADIADRDKRFERLAAEIRKSKEETDQAHDQTENRISRVRMVLVSRIADLQRELNFWRDTLRAYVAASGRQVAEADDLIEQIARRLKTQSTLGSAPDSYSIRIAAAMLEAGDQQLAKDRKSFAREPSGS